MIRKKKLLLILSFWLIPFYISYSQTETNYEIFPVYTEKQINLDNITIQFVPVVDQYLLIEQYFSVSNKIKYLLNTLSADYFNGAKLEFLEIKTVEGLKVLKINLAEVDNLENDSEYNLNRIWFHYFQGTTLGGNTTTLLTETLLQKHYKGDWIDAVFFYWNHVPFPFEYGHVKLSGILTRYPIRIDRSRLEKML